MFGVFTRDYRHEPCTSRVLVTVPQCLEVTGLQGEGGAFVRSAVFRRMQATKHGR